MADLQSSMLFSYGTRWILHRWHPSFLDQPASSNRSLVARISQGTGNPHELLARKSPLCSTVNGLGHSVSHQVLGQVSQRRWVPNIPNNSSLKSTSFPSPACSLSVSLGIRFIFLMASVWRPITCTWLQWKISKYSWVVFNYLRVYIAHN